MMWRSFEEAEAEIRSWPGRTSGEHGIDLARANIVRGRWNAEVNSYTPDETGDEVLVWDPDFGWMRVGSLL